MAVADSISAWLLPFIASIILYFVGKYAIHKGWLEEPSPPSNDTASETLEVLRTIHTTLRVIHRTLEGMDLAVPADTLNDIRGTLDRLKELGEACERDGGILIYQRIPTPHVSSAAVHLDG